MCPSQVQSGWFPCSIANCLSFTSTIFYVSPAHRQVTVWIDKSNVVSRVKPCTYEYLLRELRTWFLGVAHPSVIAQLMYILHDCCSICSTARLNSGNVYCSILSDSASWRLRILHLMVSCVYLPCSANQFVMRQRCMCSICLIDAQCELPTIARYATTCATRTNSPSNVSAHRSPS